jgi:prevent-host-death family protein
MPNIRPSADLRNKYSEISDFCHKHTEPVFITKNGQGDLAVMSIETYEMIIGKLDLYKRIEDGLDDIVKNQLRDSESVFTSLKSKFSK